MTMPVLWPSSCPAGFSNFAIFDWICPPFAFHSFRINKPAMRNGRQFDKKEECLSLSFSPFSYISLFRSSLFPFLSFSLASFFFSLFPLLPSLPSPLLSLSSLSSFFRFIPNIVCVCLSLPNNFGHTIRPSSASANRLA